MKLSGFLVGEVMRFISIGETALLLGLAISTLHRWGKEKTLESS
ncbi:MAG: hypothetical protein AB8C84_03510 [Oligoflexales bacterium]